MLAPRSNSPAASTSFASLVFPTTDSSQQPTNPKTDLAKSVIEWLFVVIAVILIVCLFLRKVFGPRNSYAQREMLIPDSAYQGARPLIDDPAYLCTYVAVELQYPLPVHSRAPARPTRGLDIGEGGRRANGDTELVLGDKDVLPAYDALDRPPRYNAVAAAGAAGVEEGQTP
ncbi:hypothetical protein B0H13DRAFT_2058269 [Mycena leptocephala]|nr:hypothetical protein B0H13DRAFT_2058269 [Mycena leptocephala]